MIQAVIMPGINPGMQQTFESHVGYTNVTILIKDKHIFQYHAWV